MKLHVMHLADCLAYSRSTVTGSAFSPPIIESTHRYTDLQGNMYKWPLKVAKKVRKYQIIPIGNNSGGASSIELRIYKFSQYLLWIQEKDISVVFLNGFFMEQEKPLFNISCTTYGRTSQSLNGNVLCFKILR